MSHAVVRAICIASAFLPCVQPVTAQPCSPGWDTRFGSQTVSGAPLKAVTFSGATGQAIALVGGFETAAGHEVPGAAAWDGRYLRPLAAGSTFRFAVDVDAANGVPGAQLFAATEQPSSFARWDGYEWIPVASTMMAPGGSAYARADVVKACNLGTGPALYAAGRFTSIEGVPARSIATWDGTHWEPLGEGLQTQFPFLLAAPTSLEFHDDGSGPALYVCGDFQQAGSVAANGFARWNGNTWWAPPNPPSWRPSSLASVDHEGGSALYARANSQVYRWTGSEWRSIGQVPSGYITEIQPFTGLDGAAYLAAVGTFTSIGGIDADQVALWNGEAWSRLHPEGLSHLMETTPEVTALASLEASSGRVALVAGRFSRAGDVGCGNLVTLDTDGWHNLGEGLLWGTPPSGSTIEWVQTAGGPAVFLGGGFVNAGGAIAGGLARWAGDHWTAMHDPSPTPSYSTFGIASVNEPDGPVLYTLRSGGGTVRRYSNGGFSILPLPFASGSHVEFRCISEFTDDAGPSAVIGGWFQGPQYQFLPGVYRWNGSSWTALIGQTRTPRRVLALLPVYGVPWSGLYAASTFTGSNESFVSRWTGSDWVPLGPGLAGAITSLHVHDDGTGAALHAAGSFSDWGGEAISNISRWDGAQWSPLGFGLPSPVTSLASFDPGSGPALFATIESPDNNLMAWDGANWTPFGGGFEALDGTVLELNAMTTSLEADGPSLWVTGRFARAGGVPSTNVARYQGCSQSTCYPNCDLSSTAPVLNVADFTCFLQRFSDALMLPGEYQQPSYVNCDGSSTAPVLNVADFQCFLQRFAQGCR